MNAHKQSELREPPVRGAYHWVFVIANSLGVLITLPIVLATLMSFDAPGSGGHWAHKLFVLGNLMLGPLCLVGLVSRSRRHWGLYGYVMMAIGWLALLLVCGGEFGCTT
ncbi:MAG: hypothetical protein ABW076_13525 [Candidatus Thiodiazotropha sp.]